MSASSTRISSVLAMLVFPFVRCFG